MLLAHHCCAKYPCYKGGHGIPGILARIFLAQLGAMESCRCCRSEMLYIKCFTSTSLQVCNKESLHQHTRVASRIALLALDWLHNPLWIPCSTTALLHFQGSNTQIPSEDTLDCLSNLHSWSCFAPKHGRTSGDRACANSLHSKVYWPWMVSLECFCERQEVCTWSSISALANNNPFHLWCNYFIVIVSWKTQRLQSHTGPSHINVWKHATWYQIVMM